MDVLHDTVQYVPVYHSIVRRWLIYYRTGLIKVSVDQQRLITVFKDLFACCFYPEILRWVLVFIGISLGQFSKASRLFCFDALLATRFTFTVLRNPSFSKVLCTVNSCCFNAEYSTAKMLYQ